MSKGRYGRHGGQYIPETLMNAVLELERAYDYYKNEPQFMEELQALYREYANRPSLLYFAEKMTRDLGGAKIYLKHSMPAALCLPFPYKQHIPYPSKLLL